MDRLMKKLDAKQKVLLMALITIALGALAAYDKYFGIMPKPEVPVHGEITGEHRFTTSTGEIISTASMAGKIWLVSFFFTSCDGPCPLLNAQIAGILGKNSALHALSITTDPETDTEQVLKDYAAKFKADPSRWIFVRTDEENMINFGQDVLKLPVGEEPDAHSPRIALVDAKGQIRGWYDSQEPNVREILLKDISNL
jgi:protein SCO1/2